jgi:hypothetical protein
MWIEWRVLKREAGSQEMEDEAREDGKKRGMDVYLSTPLL